MASILDAAIPIQRPVFSRSSLQSVHTRQSLTSSLPSLNMWTINSFRVRNPFHLFLDQVTRILQGEQIVLDGVTDIVILQPKHDFAVGPEPFELFLFAHKLSCAGRTRTCN